MVGAEDGQVGRQLRARHRARRDRGIDPLAFRYLTLTVRYGRKLNYSHESIDAAAAALGSLRGHLAALGPPPPDGPWAAPPALRAGASGRDPPASPRAWPATRSTRGRRLPRWRSSSRSGRGSRRSPLPAGQRLHDRFVAAIDDDLDLPTALAVVRETARSPDLAPDERRWLALDADLVLGLDLDRAWGGDGDSSARVADEALSPDAAALLEARSTARDARDWARADALRDELAAIGIDVVDGPDGTTWRRRTP